MPTKTVTVTIQGQADDRGQDCSRDTGYVVQLNYGQKVSDLMHLLRCMGKSINLTNVHGRTLPLCMPLRGDIVLYEK